MKKCDFKKLALLGVAGGVIFSANAGAAEQTYEKTSTTTTTTTQNGPKITRVMDEKQLLPMLDSDARAKYESMDAEGRAMALHLANQECKGRNECKGTNACRTENNECAGKGSCKGQTPRAFKDKNEAVKTAYDFMHNQRQRANTHIKNASQPAQPQQNSCNTKVPPITRSDRGNTQRHGA